MSAAHEPWPQDPALLDLDPEYELNERLGSGTAGQVWSAQQRGLDRSVAIKRWYAMDSAEELQRFAREATIMARVAHPHIVPILRYGRIQGRPALVMEHIPGCDLRTLLSALRAAAPEERQNALKWVLGCEDIPWPAHWAWWRIAVSLIAPLARALDHAHSLGVLHRDLKPSNILVHKDGRALLSDFGVAAWDPAADTAGDPAGPQAPSTQGSAEHRSQGNLAYAAPETLRGQAASRASDLYALGVIARELVTLAAPYRLAGEGPAAHIAAIDHAHWRPLPTGLPKDLRAVLEHATRALPEERYNTAGDWARDLEACSQGRAVTVRPEGWGRRSLRWVRQHRAAALWTLLWSVLLTVGPAVVQQTRWRAAQEVQAAGERAQRHFAIALDGLERVLVDSSTVTLDGQPRLDAARIALLERALQLCEDLLLDQARGPKGPQPTALAPDSAPSESDPERIRAVQNKALHGLIHARCRLGDLAEAEAAWQTLRALAKGEPSNWPIETQFLPVRIAHARGDWEQVEALAEPLLERLGGLPANAELSQRYAIEMGLRTGWIEAAIQRGDREVAAERGAQAVASARAALEAAPESLLAQRELARVLGNAAAAWIEMEDMQQAQRLTREALTLLEGLPDTVNHQQMRSIHWNNLGAIERHAGRYARAESAERHALALQTKVWNAIPSSESLRFQVGRTQYRLALSMRLHGRPTPTVRTMLRSALRPLQAACAVPHSTWNQHVLLASAASEWGQLEMEAKDFATALEAWELARSAYESARMLRPTDTTLEPFRQQAWLRRTGLAMHHRPESAQGWLTEYRLAFPGDAGVARNVATMLCVLAARVEQGQAAPPEDFEEGAQEYREHLHALALDRLTEALELGGLDHEMLVSHGPWKALQASQRFQALLQRAPSGAPEER